MKFDKETEKEIRARIKWLRAKDAAQRNPRHVDHTGSELIIGRTQGELYALERLLRQAGLKP